MTQQIEQLEQQTSSSATSPRRRGMMVFCLVALLIAANVMLWRSWMRRDPDDSAQSIPLAARSDPAPTTAPALPPILLSNYEGYQEIISGEWLMGWAWDKTKP